MSTDTPAGAHDSLNFVPNVRPIDDLGLWLQTFTRPSVWLELLVLAICVFLAWAMLFLLRRAMGGGLESGAGSVQERSVLMGRRIVDGAGFPILLLALIYLARLLLAQQLPLVVLKVALPMALSLAAIRLGVKVLEVALTQTPLVRAFERSFSWLAWGGVVLWVSGLLPLVLNELEQITWRIGSSSISVLDLLQGVLTAGAVLIVTLWISTAIEDRLLRRATGSDLSLRKAASNATRAALVFIGLIISLSAVGIDLTALSVLGGAIGVGIGFGLQKLAANYVSGFVILAERSMRIGDNVLVDGFEGRITDIKSRYTVIRALSGRESLVPNELLITQRVENLSLADSHLWMSTSVSVDYNSDVAQVRTLLEECALAQARVLREPAPRASLNAFGADGLEFVLGFWIADPENGQLALRSDINIAILNSLRQAGIEIPYPQRVLHIRAGVALPCAAASS